MEEKKKHSAPFKYVELILILHITFNVLLSVITVPP